MDERYFLSQILQDNEILFKTKVKHSDFASDFCREVYITMLSVIEKNLELDLVTIMQANPNLSPSKLAELPDAIPYNWQMYETNILERRRKHDLSVACEQVLKSTTPSSQMVATLMETIDKLEDFGTFKIVDSHKIVDETIKEIEDTYRRNGEIPGVSTGFNKLNNHLGGFQKNRLYVVGARPSVGKTALMMNFMNRAKVPIGVISAESSYIELGKRWLSMNSVVNGIKLNNGNLSKKDFSNVITAAEPMYDESVHIYDEPNISIENVIMKTREMVRRYGIKALYIDYLQQITCTTRQKRHEQVAEVSSRLKALARTLNIPIIVLAQLRRDAQERRPILSDLADSGQIERDADAILFIHRDTTDEHEKHWLLLEKNRDGQTGDIPVHFEKKYYTFREIEYGNK